MEGQIIFHRVTSSSANLKQFAPGRRRFFFQPILDIPPTTEATTIHQNTVTVISVVGSVIVQLTLGTMTEQLT